MYAVKALNIGINNLQNHGRLFFCAFLLCTAGIAKAANNEVQESALRAAYIYNFVKFISWPQDVIDNKVQLNICIGGHSPELLEKLNTLSDKPAGDLIIRITSPDFSIKEDITECQVLYVGIESAVGIDDQLLGLPILTISDLPVSESGAMISFITLDKKLRFEINLRQIRNSRLDASSYLLKLATEVYE